MSKTRNDAEQAAQAVPAGMVRCPRCWEMVTAPAAPAPEAQRSDGMPTADPMREMLKGLGFDGQCPESIGITLDRWRDGYAKWIGAAMPAPQAQAAGQELPNTEAVTACWQDFGRTEEFRRAVKWSQDGEIPGALFVAFRAGLRAASPKALAQRQPLTKAEIHALVTSAWGADSWVAQAVLDTQRACAEKWGVKLGATTGEQG